MTMILRSLNLFARLHLPRRCPLDGRSQMLTTTLLSISPVHTLGESEHHCRDMNVGALRTNPLARQRLLHSVGLSWRYFNSSCHRLSSVDPSNPDEAHLYKVKPPGRLFKEPFDSKHYRLGQQPLYEGPNASQVSFAKRWACGFSLVGSYVGYLATGVTGISTGMVTCGLVAIILPLPLIQYFYGNYVARIFRVYKTGHKRETLESLTTDEMILVEKIGLFGRSTYGVPVKLANTYAAKLRRGWVNWIYLDDKGRSVKMYVEDNLGGMRMDRIWGIVENNAGIKNTGRFPY